MASDINPLAAPQLVLEAGAIATLSGDKLLIDVAELARLTSLSTRTLRRMDAARDIPGRVPVGRRVLFRLEVIRAWVQAGLPDQKAWSILCKGHGKR